MVQILQECLHRLWLFGIAACCENKELNLSKIIMKIKLLYSLLEVLDHVHGEEYAESKTSASSKRQDN